MPRVRILQGVAGTGFSWVPGEVVEMTAEDAEKWADGYRAELSKPETPEDGAAPQVPEAADLVETPEAAQEQPETTATTSRPSRSRASRK